MQFVFDERQEHQIRAIDAVADLFDGQAYVGASEAASVTSLFPVFENRLVISDERLLANLISVQGRNGIAADGSLQTIRADVEGEAGSISSVFPNFSIEMETGTGKTYVYLRTALELHRKYGFRKYVVVVPSVAVREGVLSTLKATRSHFAKLFHNAPYRFVEYESTDLGSIRAFAQSQGVEILVMTLDSFNKASNILKQPQWRLQGQTPIHLLQSTRPILLLDEPQNMESELSVRSLASLYPLLALRYSATHRNPYNTVYRLTPFDALRQGLVKQIEVAGAIEQGAGNRVFLRLERTTAAKRSHTAQFLVHKMTKSGAVKEDTITVRPGDLLRDKTKNPRYGDLSVEEIRTKPMSVLLSDGVELRRGQAQGSDRDTLFAEQVRYTVREHIRKQRALRTRGVKVLSLFFIDRVDNYHPPGSALRRMFEHAFVEATKDLPEWKNANPSSVHAGYFAERSRNGVTETLDSITGKTKEDEAAFELIMRKKEELLSFDNPVAFIFSHSALREGWDNPNVCQICTLNQTHSEVKKRQEVGRGMRLCVDQTGRRVTDEDINVLTVVTNESYEDYVKSLQAEIESDYGKAGTPAPPKDARKRRSISLRRDLLLSPVFCALWEKINQKTRYEVSLDTEALINDVAEILGHTDIARPRIEITKAQVHADDRKDLLVVSEMGRTYRKAKAIEAHELPNLVDLMMYLLEFTTPPVRLTRRTLLQIYERCGTRDAALENPQEFASVAVRIIKSVLAERLVTGIRYTKVEDWYRMEDLEHLVERWLDTVVEAGPKSPYNWVEVDSGEERSFLAEMKKANEVELFLKLPSWFVVDTPVGAYNPDWAIVWRRHDAHGERTVEPDLYLIAETKSTRDLTKLRPQERQKILCGTEHFVAALGVPFDVAVGLGDVRILADQGREGTVG